MLIKCHGFIQNQNHLLVSNPNPELLSDLDLSLLEEFSPKTSTRKSFGNFTLNKNISKQNINKMKLELHNILVGLIFFKLLMVSYTINLNYNTHLTVCQ